MFSPSIFGDVLKLLPRDKIRILSEKHGSDRWRKSFKTWDHLVALLAGQLSGLTSLREVEVLFDEQRASHYHLACGGVKKSTLADANKKRSYEVFAGIAQLMLALGGRRARSAKAVLSVLDSSPIMLKGRGHQWAEKSRTRVSCQGLKLHLLLSLDDGGLDYAAVTDMNINDITDARSMALESGRIYVFDKGYYDYNWWHEIIGKGSHFVTRIKKNAAYRVLETRSMDGEENDNIIGDQVIELTNKAPRGGKINALAGCKLRLVEIEHPSGKGTPFLIISDMMEASAREIAACYKQRWSIELLFKWIKQNLKIKRFMGESKNAILIQLFTAIIAYLLIKMYKTLLGKSHSGRLKDLVTTLKTSLFQPRQDHRRRSTHNPSMQPELWGLI